MKFALFTLLAAPVQAKHYFHGHGYSESEVGFSWLENLYGVDTIPEFRQYVMDTSSHSQPYSNANPPAISPLRLMYPHNHHRLARRS